MESQSTDIIAEAALQSNTAKRKNLLVWWIKVCCWIFLVLGALAPLILTAGLLGYSAEVALYGLEAGNALSLTGMGIITLFSFKGLISYALLKEKDWAVNLALLDGIAGIIICIAVMFTPGDSGAIRLELLALIPYVVKMHKIREEWAVRKPLFV